VSGRIAAIGALGALLAIVIAFLAVAVLGPREPETEPLPTITHRLSSGETEGAVRIAGGGAQWRVEGRIWVDALRGFQVRVVLEPRGNGGATRAAPELVLASGDPSVAPLRMRMLAAGDEGAGVYDTGGLLPVAGRWEGRLVLPGEVLGFDFVVAR
jgi:hypothetical protein